MSLAIFIRQTAVVFMVPEKFTIASCAAKEANLFVDGLSVAALGNHRVGAAQTGTEAKWKNIGTEDTTIVFISPQSGNGAGILTVEYLQNRALA